MRYKIYNKFNTSFIYRLQKISFIIEQKEHWRHLKSFERVKPLDIRWFIYRVSVKLEVSYKIAEIREKYRQNEGTEANQEVNYYL